MVVLERGPQPQALCPLHQCTCCDVCVNAAAAFLTKNVTLDDITIKFEIWDTAGQGETRPDLFFLLRSSRRSSGYGVGRTWKVGVEGLLTPCGIAVLCGRVRVQSDTAAWHPCTTVAQGLPSSCSM